MNAFICMVPFHYYLFKNVAKHLDNYEFLIPPMTDKKFSKEYGGGMSADGLYGYTKSFLRRKNVNISDYGEPNSKNLVEYVNQNIRNIICPHMFDGIFGLSNTRIILMAYAMAEKIAFKYEIIYLMDLILTYGNESANWVRQKGINTIFVGNPLFDDWFGNDVDNKYLKVIQRQLDPERKTLLYLPTWNEVSSIDAFFEEIASLTDQYNVIVKLHHGTFNGEPNRLCSCLSFSEVIVLGDYFDPLPLYKVSDVVITDGMSGAIFDALLVDKQVLTVGTSIYDFGMGTVSDLSNFFASIPFIDDPKELRGILEEMMTKRCILDQNVKNSLFSYQDGQAGKRAAEAIMDDKKYPLISTLKKFKDAIDKAPNEEIRKRIVKMRNSFASKYNQSPYKKSHLALRIYQRLKR